MEPGLLEELARLFATEAAGQLDRLERALDDAAGAPGAAPGALAEARRVLHGLKGGAYSAGFRAFGDLAHALEDALRARAEAPTPALLQAARRAVAALAAAAQAIAVRAVEPGSDLDDARTTLLLALAAPDAPAPAARAGAAAPPAEGEAIGRVDLTQLEALSSRLIDVHERAEGLARRLRDSALTDAALEATRLARGLREANRRLADLRLRPLRELTSALRATFDDALARTGKVGDLETHGEDVLLDRRVAERLRSSLGHVVRNAVDHGFEPGEVRRAAGKPERPRLTVRAVARGIRVELTVEDDGAGIDLAAVARVARERGLLGPQDEPAPEVLLRLPFLPGFTTRSDVTATSGRGVGLDAVRADVEDMNGRLSLRSSPGRGTRLLLEVPASLASCRALVARRAGRRFAVPLIAARRIVDLSAVEVEVVGGARTVRAGAERLPLSDMADVLGAPGGRAELQAIVVEIGDQALALGVDLVEQEAELTVRPVGEPLGGLRYVAGLALVGDEVLPIVDLVDVARDPPRAGGARPLAAADGPASASVVGRTVLVIDDSVTTRTLERNVLVNAGYRVVTAVDGQEGLELLARGGIDLVITDLEMPRVDGVELLRRMARDPALTTIPAILVTSRADFADEALRAGARACVIKRAFDQEKLLDEVARLLG